MKATLTFTPSTDDEDIYMAAAPTTGTWVKNNKVWNSNPVPGENMGWVCTASGTPGTWAAFGVITL